MPTELEPQPQDDPDFTEAWKAYERGDFRSVRTIARASAGASKPTVKRVAGDLLRRTGVDSAQVLVLTACALFFAWAVWRYAL